MAQRWDRDELLRRVDLSALLDDLAGPPARGGPSARWHCPASDHDDVHPSVSVFTDRHGVERWRCWSGGHGGTAIDAIVLTQRVGVRDAVEDLARRAGMSPDDRSPRQLVRKPRPPVEQVPLSPDVVRYADACAEFLWKPIGRPVLNYLVEERGLDPEVLRLNRVGADPGPERFRRARGLPRGGPGAVFPILDGHGHVAYCQTRYLETPAGRSKYDNPAGRLGHNPRLGWTRPVDAAREPVLVCEGLPDAYTANEAGYDAVAILGVAHVCAPVADHLAAQVRGRPVIVALDGDDAGRAASRTLCSSLEVRGTMVIEFPLPPGADLNSWVHSARTAPELGHQRWPDLETRSAPIHVPTVAEP